MTRYEGPRPLAPSDRLADFHSGEPALDGWLTDHAIRAEASKTARTYLVTDADTHLIVGYYCLSSHSVAREAIGGGRLARNAPDAVPVVLLGRLAVDARYQGAGLGAALLKDAILKAIAAAGLIGAHALLVHALSPGVARFYQRYGFRPLPAKAETLYLPLDRLTSGS